MSSVKGTRFLGLYKDLARSLSNFRLLRAAPIFRVHRVELSPSGIVLAYRVTNGGNLVLQFGQAHFISRPSYSNSTTISTTTGGTPLGPMRTPAMAARSTHRPLSPGGFVLQGRVWGRWDLRVHGFEKAIHRLRLSSDRGSRRRGVGSMPVEIDLSVSGQARNLPEPMRPQPADSSNRVGRNSRPSVRPRDL